MSWIVRHRDKKYKVLSWEYEPGDLVAEFNITMTEVMNVFIAEYIYPQECLIKKIEPYNE